MTKWMNNATGKANTFRFGGIFHFMHFKTKTQ